MKFKKVFLVGVLLFVFSNAFSQTQEQCTNNGCTWVTTEPVPPYCDCSNAVNIGIPFYIGIISAILIALYFINRYKKNEITL